MRVPPPRALTGGFDPSQRIQEDRRLCRHTCGCQRTCRPSSEIRSISPISSSGRPSYTCSASARTSSGVFSVSTVSRTCCPSTSVTADSSNNRNVPFSKTASNVCSMPATPFNKIVLSMDYTTSFQHPTLDFSRPVARKRRYIIWQALASRGGSAAKKDSKIPLRWRSPLRLQVARKSVSIGCIACTANIRVPNNSVRSPPD